MARTPSTMVELGSIASEFTLPNPVKGTMVGLDDVLSDKATVLMFVCNHCPFVIHVEDELIAIAREYQAQGISFVAISSNDVENYPDDSPEKMKERSIEKSYPFPYLYDETQEVARAYQAACTPDFFVYNSSKELIYRGQLDDSRPESDIPVTGKDLRAVLDAVVSGREIPKDQKPSLGCNIKWKS